MMGHRIELSDVQALLAQPARGVALSNVRHVYDARPCQLCDRAAVVQVSGQDLCGRHAFGTSAGDRQRLMVDRMGEIYTGIKVPDHKRGGIFHCAC